MARPGDPRSFRVSGVVEEAETGRPLPRLIVRAFDRDWLVDDKVGFATTDDDGQFEIRYSTADFQDLREESPDLYVRVYDADGIDVLYESTEAIRWNASTDERYRIRIPARALPRAR